MFLMKNGKTNSIKRFLSSFLAPSRDVHTELGVGTVACDSSSVSHTLGGKNCRLENDPVARSPEALAF